MAAAWAYCCRLGTADPRGNNAATRVRGQYHCHGTTKRTSQRKWGPKSQDELDAFCVEQVQKAVEDAGEGAQLVEGVSEKMAADRLRNQIAPVYVVHTGRICVECWRRSCAIRRSAKLRGRRLAESLRMILLNLRTTGRAAS